MYFLYSLLLVLGVVALLPRFILDALRHGKYSAGLAQRAGFLPEFDTSGRPILWLHCVSVGEAQAARPLVDALNAEFGEHTLVISTTTLTGQLLARKLFVKQAALVFYFPFDWTWCVRRALKSIKPSAVLLMETELWPNFLRECNRRDIQVALINGRISEQSFRRYRLVSSFVRRVVSQVTLAIMQTEADASRIRSLGLPPERVKVSGNVKFDAGEALGEQELSAELRRRFAINGQHPLIIAASTHAPEEAVVLDAFRPIADANGQKPRLLVAPRHPERFDEVAALIAASGFSFARRSAPHLDSDARVDVILLDTIGELRAAYPLAELVFVGGSIARIGGHNILEPASAGKCIVTGPHTSNFQSIVNSFVEQDAVVQLASLNQSEARGALSRVLRNLLLDDERRRRIGENARAAVELDRGATSRTIRLLSRLMSDESTISDKR